MSYAVTEDLDLGTLGTASKATMNTDTRFNLVTNIEERCLIAYIMQQSLDALAREENVLNCILRAFEAAQDLELGQVTKQQAVESYCSCPDPATKALVEHYCMECWQIYACDQLTWHNTDAGATLTCSKCVDRVHGLKSPDTVRGRIRRAVGIAHRIDSESHNPLCTKDELVQMLVDAHTTAEDEMKWVDGYSDDQGDLREAHYRAGDRTSGSQSSSHPFGLSVEKPHQRWIRRDGQLSLHDLENITLTKDCINRVKSSTLAASALPL